MLGLTYASPAPKANDDLARANFYTDCAKVKNGLALGVRVNAVVMRFIWLKPEVNSHPVI